MTAAAIRAGVYQGVAYEIADRTPFPGIGWRLREYDHLGRPLGFHTSPGAWYDEPGQPSAADLAEASVKRAIDKMQD